MTAVTVAGQVRADDPELLGEGGGHVCPPVGVGASPVDEDETAGAGRSEGQGVDRAAVDVDRQMDRLSKVSPNVLAFIRSEQLRQGLDVK